MARKHGTSEERFSARLDKRADGCWLWTGKTKNGYAIHWADRHRRWVRAHRFAYEMAKGAIPDGLVIDHICRVKHCVNPDHLEAVTQAENVIRHHSQQTHCKHGHELTAARGRRVCRTCARQAYRRWKVRHG